MHFTDPGRIKVFLNDPDKKNLLTICKEVLVLWATKKEIPIYYFKHLYKKDVTNYKDYLAPGEVRKIWASDNLHRSEYTSIMHNKLSFALYCERSGLASPALVSYNFCSSFFFGGELHKISDLDALVAFYGRVFDAIDVAAIFFRPLALNGGQGCFKIDRENYRQQLQQEAENLMSGDYVHTETLAQHADIARIYGTSINTLRILTFIDGDGVDIVSSFIRIGAGGSLVDNGSSGGLFVGIEQNSGRLKKTGYRDLKFGGGEFDRHPDTGVVFENLEVPYFEEACEMVRQAAEWIPNRFIGWDVAITPHGPMVIEGNEDPHLFMSDVAYGGLLQNPVMRRVLSSI